MKVGTETVMSDWRKSKTRLIAELAQLSARISALERTETELTRVADAFKQSETKFRKITEKSIVGVYVIQDDLFRYTNPHMAEIFGFEVEDLINKRGPKDVVYPEDWPMVGGHLAARIAGKMDSINYQFRGLKRTGEVIHVEVYGSRMEYNGRPAVIGTLVDITRRVGVERNLEIQLEKFEALYHLAVTITAENRLEENLRLVVEKSHELLGADMAFIALRQEGADELSVRAHSGIRTEALKASKIQFRTAGETSGDRIDAEQFPQHFFERIQASFPDSARAEGIVSGLAVPVDIGATNLGVLLISNRTPRTYTESEVETLTLMGNLLALEITRKQTEEALVGSEKELRTLSRRLLTAQEDERKRVAQDLHDGIGQSLTALKFEVENAVRKISGDVPEETLGPLNAVFPMIQDVIEEVGRIAMDLRPSILDDLGVLATIGWLCREFQKTCSDIRVVQQIDVVEGQIPEHQKIVIFRILQEALNNVAKHSGATEVRVFLRARAGRVELIVKDNGMGFDCSSGALNDAGRTGFGLAGMKERARLSGGAFSISASVGAGAVIEASWPEEQTGSRIQ